ncbi:MAG: hypothetical protein ACRCW1_04715, partial [Anaerotignaceae bacterium]
RCWRYVVGNGLSPRYWDSVLNTEQSGHIFYMPNQVVPRSLVLHMDGVFLCLKITYFKEELLNVQQSID